jgi:hypothetical protein
MAFLEKYTIQPIPLAARGLAATQTPQDRARSKLLSALEVQHRLLAAQLKGETFTVTRNGKQIAPRPFWAHSPMGVAFTPRFGNQFLFETGQGVMVHELGQMAQVLSDFEEAVKAKEFDVILMSISESRGGRGADAGSGSTKRGRGRPRRV